MNVQHVDKAIYTSFFDSNLLLVHSTCRKKWTGSICFDMSKGWKNRSTCCQKRQHVERQHSTCQSNVRHVASTCRIRHVASTCCWCGRGFKV